MPGMYATFVPLTNNPLPAGIAAGSRTTTTRHSREPFTPRTRNEEPTVSPPMKQDLLLTLVRLYRKEARSCGADDGKSPLLRVRVRRKT